MARQAHRSGPPTAVPSASIRPGEPPVTRDTSVLPERAALLIIDVQYLCAVAGHGIYADSARAEADSYYLRRVERQVIPNIQRLQAAFRERGGEVIFTVIESLTQDGRDRSLDHKLSNYHAPKGSHEAQVVEPIKPVGDEIIIPRTSSGIFNSTNIDYVLRNLGIDFLVIAGVCTNQCVESAVRDAADRGYLVTLIEDACAAHSEAEHEASLKVLAGYARIRATDAVVAEIHSQTPARC